MSIFLIICFIIAIIVILAVLCFCVKYGCDSSNEQSSQVYYDDASRYERAVSRERSATRNGATRSFYDRIRHIVDDRAPPGHFQHHEVDTAQDDRARRREADALKVAQMRKIQSRLVVTPLSADDLDCNLLIGVDANPHHIGGYAVHLPRSDGAHYTPGLEMYTFHTRKLPWELHDTSIVGDSKEFEMKNLLFALLLW